LTLPIRHTRHLAIAVTVLLAVEIGLLVFRAIAFVMRIDLLDRIKEGAFVTRDQARASDQLVGASSLLWLLAFLATGIVWLVWQHRAQSNARDLTAGGTSVTPGWAVGWWFVPFANFVKPLQAMHELWQASAGGTTWSEQRVSPVLVAWWLSWLGFNLSGLFALNPDTTNVDSLLRADRIHVVTMGLGIVAAGLAIVVVRSIVTRQGSATAQVQLMIMPPPPAPLPEPPPSPAT
jgi:Domain of unknown function (DUF4328)